MWKPITFDRLSVGMEIVLIEPDNGATQTWRGVVTDVKSWTLLSGGVNIAFTLNDAFRLESDTWRGYKHELYEVVPDDEPLPVPKPAPKLEDVLSILDESARKWWGPATLQDAIVQLFEGSEYYCAQCGVSHE